jgi:hypothetical protein
VGRNAMVALVVLAAAGLAGCADEPADNQASLAATAAVTAPALSVPADSMRADSVPADSAGPSVSEQALADSLAKAREIEVMRETFAYAGGTRDPFASLIDLDKTGPEIADLDLVGVYMDLRSPSNNVVVLREKASAKRHKMRVGDQLGRARLTQIRPRDAVFMISDFGFERQETLSLRKQEVETP